jgi:hypothetical protein
MAAAYGKIMFISGRDLNDLTQNGSCIRRWIGT